MAAGNSFFGYPRGFEIKDSETIMEIIKCSLSEYYTKSLILDLYRAWPQAFIVYDNFDSVAGFIIGAKYSGTEGRILLFAVKQEYLAPIIKPATESKLSYTINAWGHAL